MRSVQLHELAVAEAVEAAAWYESHRAGLGTEFREQLKLSLDTLVEIPFPGKAWPERLGERGIKRITMRRFPFFLVFVSVESGFVVLAVAHHRRRPGYWRSRI